MVSRPQRIHGFQGTDQEYIAYLESLVPLETANRPPSYPPQSRNPQPRNPSHFDVRDEAIASFDDESPDESIEFVLYKPPTIKPTKRKRAEQRWEREMDELIRNIRVGDWSSRRSAMGLSSEPGILMALDTTIHGPQQGCVTSQEGPPICYDPSTAVLGILNSFATTTTALQMQEKFMANMFSFRVLVFVSLCCVALHHGSDLGEVNKIMQKCVSATSEKNLTRLRKGALWVNRMMALLAADGWNYRAYEIFILWGQSMAQYGRFAEAGKDGISYFRNRMPKSKPEYEIQASLPFWIPFIIKTIVGDAFSLLEICTALNYGTDQQIHDYPRYLNNYRNRRMQLPTQCTAALENQSQVDVLHSGPNETGIPICDSPFQIQSLLEAARQVDYLQRSVAGPSEGITDVGRLDLNTGVLDLNDSIEGWGGMNFFNDEWLDIFPIGSC